jgi:hypothetical protein
MAKIMQETIEVMDKFPDLNDEGNKEEVKSSKRRKSN